MPEPQDRLAEIQAYRDELYGANVVGPTDLISIRMDALDWLIGEVERLRGEVETLTGVYEGAQEAEIAARTKLVEIRTLIYHFFEST